MTLRVCHFAASRGLGRGEAYVDLSNRMAQTRDDVEVGLLAPRDALYKGRLHERVTLLEYKSKDSRNNPLLWLECASLLRRFNPALIHTHFAKATEVYMRIKPVVGIPYVATKHNPRKGRVFEKAPNVIAVADIVRQSIGHGRVTVIHNGIVPVDIPRPPRDPDAPLRFLSVGRLDPIKGYDRLIKALATHDRPWTLDLVGEGEHRGELETLIAKLGLRDKVKLPGFSDQAPQLMAGCDVFILSSHSEGCSVALLEAMHYAPLVLSTPVGLAPELFPGWLMWDADDPATLGPVFDDYRSLVEQYAGWSAGTLRRFHLDETVHKHVAYYQRVLGAA